MKINDSLAIDGPNNDEAFTWVITGRSGACAYYQMPRSEADKVIEVLRRGTAAWWEEQRASVQPYVEKGGPVQGPLPLVPVEAYDQGRDPGDEHGV